MSELAPHSHPPENTPALTVADLGEFPLIQAIVSRLGAPRADTVVGAGDDDTAVLRARDGSLQLATIDSQVAGVHFRLERVPPETIGRKLAAVNLSDIAAMGGRPTHGLLALSAPASLSSELALRIAEGLAAELARWGADLVGGNVSRAAELVLDLALLGEVEPQQLLLRSGGRPGDLVLVTGDLGAAAAGAYLLAGTEAAGVSAEHRAAVLARQCAPEPRLEVAPLLGPLGASACIDISDGLAADLGHLCARSQVGAVLEAQCLPIAAATRAVAEALGQDPLRLALSGGEDYELLLTAPSGAAPRLIETVAMRTGVPVVAIGRLTEGGALTLRLPDGGQEPLVGGWRHF